MNAWNDLLTSGGALDLSQHVKLRLTGPDALRYLNGQVSNDLRRLAAGDSLPACLCTHKGRLEALVMISRAGDAYLITADAALRDFLPLRLEKYLIADDAVLEDITDTFALAHLFGAAAAKRKETGALAQHPAYNTSRLGESGVDVWLPPGETAGLNLADAALVETLRIARGIPAWESEMAGGILPPEARLDESAIDYHKGCYTGQEVISRLRSVGQVNRRLERLVAEGGERIEAGWQLFAVADDGTLTAAGNVTSAARHPVSEKWLGLGFVKRQAAGADLIAAPDADSPRVPVQIRKTLDDAEG